MTSEQFRTLSLDLRRVAKEIPLSWGHVQNNRYDNELKHYCNIFAVMSLDELKTIIDSFDNDHKSYYLRRWYLLRCADCDIHFKIKNLKAGRYNLIEGGGIARWNIFNVIISPHEDHN